MTTLDEALAELREAQEERETPAAALAKLQAEYGELGQKAQRAGTVVEQQQFLREQQRCAHAQSPFIDALRVIDARIETARRRVGKSA